MYPGMEAMSPDPANAPGRDAHVAENPWGYSIKYDGTLFKPDWHAERSPPHAALASVRNMCAELSCPQPRICRAARSGSKPMTAERPTSPTVNMTNETSRLLRTSRLGCATNQRAAIVLDHTSNGKSPGQAEILGRTCPQPTAETVQIATSPKTPRPDLRPAITTIPANHSGSNARRTLANASTQIRVVGDSRKTNRNTNSGK